MKHSVRIFLALSVLAAAGLSGCKGGAAVTIETPVGVGFTLDTRPVTSAVGDAIGAVAGAVGVKTPAAAPTPK